jgi:hypothetical protein
MVPKESYTVNESITMDISLMSGDTKDWIGIYPIGSNNEWKNVVSWKWTDGKGVNWEKITLPKVSKVGNYEARAFFKNSFQQEGKSRAFKVTLSNGGETELLTERYHVRDCFNRIFVSFKNMGNNPNDWIALYPINSSNEWKNVKAWRWIENMENNRVPLTYPKDIASGEYEIRAFFKNSFTLEARSNPIFITSCSSKIKLTTSQEKYSLNEPIKVNFTDSSNREKNWIGIYKAGTKTLIENNLAWQWTNNQKEGQLIFNDLPTGKYDVRAFFNNSYDIEALISFEITDEVQDDFPKVLLNGDENPEAGVYVKYHQDRAYISITDRSIYFDNHKGLTLIDYSDSQHPSIITSNSNYAWGEFSKTAQLTENGEILIFIDNNWKMISVTADSLALLDDNIEIGYAPYRPSLNKVTGHNLFYTVHSWAEQPKYRYYYVNLAGEITQVALGSAGSDYNYLIDKGVIGANKYFITHRKRNWNRDGKWESHKVIYDISNLPEVVSIETIIFDVQP